RRARRASGGERHRIGCFCPPPAAFPDRTPAPRRPHQPDCLRAGNCRPARAVTKFTLLFAAVGAMALAFAAIASGDDASTVARLGVCGGALGVAAVVDLAQHRVPNRIVLPAAAACAALSLAGGNGARSLATGLALV